jgi:two-component system, OmpR family, response regulator RegX3
LRIALLEDDSAQIDLVTLWLNGAGHSCEVFTCGKDLKESLTRTHFDFFVLDWELPDTTGLEVLKWLAQNERSRAPVIFTSARDSEEHIAMNLRAGADDYLVKPLRKLELLARIDAVARRVRSRSSMDSVLTFNDLHIDIQARSVTRNGQAVRLTRKDFDLAVVFFRNLGRLVSRRQILESVWGSLKQEHSRTIAAHVSRLRTRLGLVPVYGWKFAAVYQHGYRLESIGVDAIPPH